MKTDIFTAEAVVRMLREQIVASIAEITDALGVPSHRTVCRKLVQGAMNKYRYDERTGDLFE